jgi:hypothetical protein
MGGRSDGETISAIVVGSVLLLLLLLLLEETRYLPPLPESHQACG